MNNNLNIAIIIGSTRPGRIGAGVAEWALEQAKGRAAKYEIVDIADFNLPLYDEPLPASNYSYQNEHTKRWSKVIDRFDGYIFVTPEYNHATSGALKNAVDYLWYEWNNKAAGFIGYGSAGGTRAVENLRTIASELELATVRKQVILSLYTDFKDYVTFVPSESQNKKLAGVFEQVETWSAALAPVRAAAPPRE